MLALVTDAVAVAELAMSPPAAVQAVVATRVFQLTTFDCQKLVTSYAWYVRVPALAGGAVVTCRVNIACLMPTFGMRDRSNSTIARSFAPVAEATVSVLPTLLLLGVA